MYTPPLQWVLLALVYYCALLVNDNNYVCGAPLRRIFARTTTTTLTTSASMKNQATSPPPSFFDFLSIRPTISVSKFPLIVEIVAQRIQSQFSNYIYEDLSRPPTYDRPTYKPEVYTTTIASSTTGNKRKTSVPLVIPTVGPPQIVLVDTYELVHNSNFNTTIQVEYQLKHLNTDTGNSSKDSLEQDVYLILTQNELSENVTYIFEKYSIDADKDDYVYKEVSDIFKDKQEAVKYLLRYNNDIVEANYGRRLITLTKIRQRVFVNTIKLNCHLDVQDADVQIIKDSF